MAWYPGVSTHPGAIAFTRTRGASSSASDRVNATTAVFDAQYSSCPGDGTKASIEAKLTTAEPSTRCRAQVGEISGAIAYLAGDDSSFVTGTELIIDGGYLAR